MTIPLTTGKIGKSTYPFQMEATSQIESGNGLQNSSWPMFHHDIHHSGQSPYGKIGNGYSIKWKFLMDGLTISSPAIDYNGTIYIGAQDFHKSFFSIDQNGNEKWRFDAGEYVDSSPAIGNSETIYFASENGNLNALNSNGTMKWITHIGNGWIFSSPVIDHNGTIYITLVNNNCLCAINPNGTIKWYFYAEDSIYCSPAISDDGTIYFGSNDGYMYAIYPDGALKWKFYAGGTKGIGSSPAIGVDNTIYFGSTSGYLYALYPNGTLRWATLTGYIGESSPAFSIDGTIYIGDQENYRIYSINPDGIINWYYKTNGEILSSPAIDKNGIIYCGSMDGNLYALNPNGTLLWKFYAGDNIESSVVIGKNGSIYIAAQILPPPNFHSYLYCLENIDNDPPMTPSITGQMNGKVGHEYDYTIDSTDPDNENISYYIDWGDETNTGWIGPYPSGQEQTLNHSWNKKGTYTIKAKARDTHDQESDWATLPVKMPYEPPHFHFLEWLFERFPHAFPILRQIMGY